MHVREGQWHVDTVLVQARWSVYHSTRSPATPLVFGWNGNDRLRRDSSMIPLALSKERVDASSLPRTGPGQLGINSTAVGQKTSTPD